MSSLQYNEYYHQRTGLTVGVKRQLFSRQSPWQRVEVFETDSWGNLLTIDGMVMLSEKDEFVYHEMLTHVGLFTHPEPGNILIIGGGDGGTAREVMKHPSVQRVDLVEIDETVVEASRQFLPEVGDFDNPKLNLIIGDGLDYVKATSRRYDVIIVDGSDPVGPAEGLFSREFYLNCHSILTGSGILVAQTESPWVSSYHDGMHQLYQTLTNLFRHAHLYLCYIPLYPSGMWSMMIASREEDPLDPSVIQRAETGLSSLGELHYYTPDVHKAAFALPGFVNRIITGGGSETQPPSRLSRCREE